MQQLDVPNALLQRSLDEIVFMEQLKGFIHPQLLNHVCALKKSLYGLKLNSSVNYQRH